MTTPVYICTGFLDSGKTTFIKDTLMKQEWIEEGPTLLLQCEEGEEEYSEKYLDENGLFLFNIESPSASWTRRRGSSSATTTSP